MSEPRIFLEPSGHRWGNRGDAMMFEVAMERLRASWPRAEVTVHTLEPEGLHRIDAAAQPLASWGARAWSAVHGVPARVRVAQLALLAKGHDVKLVRAYLDAVRTADLVLVTGAGSLNDAFARNALVVLDTLSLGIEAGAVTALLGQGIGPMTNRALRRRAAEVLPRVDFLALREGLASLPLLASLGVPAERVVVTGDDAIAHAYRARPPHLGSALGFNLRAAEYSEFDDALISRIGTIVREHSAPIIALVNSRNAGEDDLATLRRALGDDVADADLLDALRRCRLVVAGSYHAAVLALSMGIPAVTIAKSQYYVDKFRGLAAQFGDACRVLNASDADFDTRLRTAIDEASQTADATRNALLDAAAAQIERGEAAWRQLAALVEGRRIERMRS